MMDLFVNPLGRREVRHLCKTKHYLKRVPTIEHAFGLFDAPLFGRCFGFITFGTPPSRHLMLSACRTRPDMVTELNRLWLDDEMGFNSESWFLARVLRLMPPRIVVSYADTAVGHVGTVYRASNFFYAGMTDQDRSTPRFDYVTQGQHSRCTTRNGTMETAERVRRKPKHRYWCVTGDRRERRRLLSLATWPKMSWQAARSAAGGVVP